MDESRYTDQGYLVGEQYRDGSNLRARGDLHGRFSTNPRGWMAWLFDEYLARLDAQAPLRVLEVGCGPGMQWVSQRARIPAGWQVTLTDLSAGMVAEARANLGDLPNFGFAQADAMALEMADNALDAVIANHMLYHVPDMDRALSEFARVLKPGGWLFAATNGSKHVLELRRLAEQVLPFRALWHTGQMRHFALEVAVDILLEHFDDVTMRPYIDSLRITEPDAAVAYVFSAAREADRKPAHMQALHDAVARIIRERGAFEVQKETGLLVARK